MVRCLVLVFAFVLALMEQTQAQSCNAYPNTLTNGTNADATQVMGNFNYVLSCVRDKLTANRTYYVRTDGNDSNSGLANTAAGAFLTIQRAIDAVAAIDMSTFQATVQVGSGAYTGAVVFKNWVGAIRPILQGDTATPSNVVINVTSNDAVLSDAALPWQIQGVQIKTTTSGYSLRARNGGKIYFQSVDFAASGNSHIVCQGGASIKAIGSYSISGTPGGDGIHAFVADGGFVDISGVTVTLTNTPVWSGGMANASRNGTLSAFGMTFTGAATGARYTATANGVIYTAGGGAGYFPGSAAGSTSLGGLYL